MLLFNRKLVHLMIEMLTESMIYGMKMKSMMNSRTSYLNANGISERARALMELVETKNNDDNNGMVSK